MSHSLARLAIHLVFATRDRRRVLGDPIRGALHGYMVTVLQNFRCNPVAINSVEDHVHILFELGRTVALSNAVEAVKRTSSRWMKTQGEDFARFAWQAGYGAFAVSESNTTAVRRYIEKQKERHQRLTFEDEFRALLRLHGIVYDEAYFCA